MQKGTPKLSVGTRNLSIFLKEIGVNVDILVTQWTALFGTASSLRQILDVCGHRLVSDIDALKTGRGRDWDRAESLFC